MIWGLFPVLLNIKGFGLADVGRVVAIYPIVWGLGQLITGRLADIWNKKSMLFWGMLIQGMAIITMIFASSFVQFTLLSTLLGIGTVVVYPTFLAAIADYTHPEQRAKSIGVFRLWRDSGYAIGAVLTGIIADFFGINISIIFIGLITLLSSLVIKIRMK